LLSQFWLDPKVTKRSRQKKASTRPDGSLRFFRAAHIAKAKPSFPPYSLARFSVRPLPAFVSGYI
jgi:hypothetical protein